MNQMIELSEKLLKELEKKKKSPEDSIENVIWYLIDQANTNAKNEFPKSYTNRTITGLLSNKTLKDVFG